MEKAGWLRTLCSHPPFWLLLILSLVQASPFQRESTNLHALNVNAFHRFAYFALNSRLVIVLEQFWNPAHLNNRAAVLKAFFLALKVGKKKKKTRTVILFSFQSNVNMESINITKVTLFSHTIENARAAARIRWRVSSAVWTPSYPHDWSSTFACFLINHREGLLCFEQTFVIFPKQDV